MDNDALKELNKAISEVGEELAKGGPGSGKKGHTTAKKPGLAPGPNDHTWDSKTERAKPEYQAKLASAKQRSEEGFNAPVTRSGKMIGHRANHPDHHDFTADDHEDAMAYHRDSQGPLNHKLHLHHAGREALPPVEEQEAAHKIARHKEHAQAHMEASDSMRSMKKSEETEELEKAKKTGEGSRGGKIVGHTKSGKPIYEDHGNSAHADFDRHDHMDAADHHRTKMGADDVQAEAKEGNMKRLDNHAEQSMKHHHDSTQKFIAEMQEDRKAKGKPVGKTRSGKDIHAGKTHAQVQRDRDSTPMGQKTPPVKEDKHHENYTVEDHVDAMHFHEAGHKNSSGKTKDSHYHAMRHHDDKVMEHMAGKQPSEADKANYKESKEHYHKNAEKMKKSDEGENMDELLKTIKALGRDGLKKAIPSLTDEQKELLGEVLSKAKDLSKEAQMSDNKKPQKTREPKTEERSNSEEGVDEADEKLMADQNKTQDHQGGGDSKPEGWEGQVIKSEAREEAKEKIMSMEEKEHGTKNPKKLVEAEKQEHKVEKAKAEDQEDDSEGQELSPEEKAAKKAEKESLEKSEIMHKMVERMRKRGMDRPKCLEAMKKKGYDHQMADKLWGDQDESDKAGSAKEQAAQSEENKIQPKDNDSKKVSDKTKPNPEQKQDKQPKLEKSIVWGDPQAQIRAGSQGRKMTYSVSEEIIKSGERRDELKKSGQTFHDESPTDEVLEKSGFKKTTLNDLIEKSLDRSTDQLRDEGSSLIQAKATVSSFSEEDFLKSWNMADQSKLKKLSNKPDKSDEQKAKEDAEKQAEKKANGEE